MAFDQLKAMLNRNTAREPNQISNLVTDYIQKRRGEPGLFSFEHNLLPKLISNFLPLHGPGINVVDKYALAVTKIWLWGVIFGHAQQALSLSYH